MGAELFHADGQTDLTRVTVSFRNFSNVSKNRDTLLLPVFIFVIVYINCMCWFYIPL